METPIQSEPKTVPLPAPSVPDRIRALRQQQRELMALPAEAALAVILDQRQPLPLVHAFPEEDFYLLVHEIGPEDALELLGLASNRQWEFLLDAEVWDRDRINPAALTRWMGLLMRADPNRLVRWAAQEKFELVEYYFYRNLDIAIREEDQDPADFPEDYFSDDEVFYLRFLPGPGSGSPESEKEERDAFLTEFLRRLSREDHPRYQGMLLEAASILPAEMEEELYRRRTIRRAERGFAPFAEAVGIYQGLSPEALAARYPRVLRAEDGPTPATPAELLPKDDPLSQALDAPDLSDVLGPLQAEFAGLCNHLIVADRRTVQDRDALAEVARKAASYIAVGVEAAAGGRSPARAAALIRRHSLIDLFRTGYGQAQALKRRAEVWHANSWSAGRGLPLTFWGEDWLGVIGGLLIARPLFYDDRLAGERYRDFRSLDDIRRTETVLERIIAADRLLARIDPPAVPVRPERLVTWSALLPTLWARHRLGLSRDLAPIPTETFRPFFEALWESGPPDAQRPLAAAARDDLVHWLADETGWTPDALRHQAGGVLAELVAFLEAELGRVDADNLDPRFVLPFLLS